MTPDTSKDRLQKRVVVSAIQPTGRLHVGNYIGAVSTWERMQDDNECFFPLVDLHALTVRQDSSDLRKRSYDFAALYLACGIDPKKSAVFAQSHVPAHAELGWVLTCQATMGELNRMTQYKSKAESKSAGVNAGLFLYPVLMAADILLYQTNLVPIGADQKQHLELTRDLAMRMNSSYGPIFTVPEALFPTTGARIMSLQDPLAKMSKSDPLDKNILALLDPPEVIRNKLARSVTDSLGHIACDPTRPGISNLVTIYAALTNAGVEDVETRYAGKGYGQFKADLAEIVNATLTPIQERYVALRANESALEDVLEDGAARARERANRTLSLVYDKMGLIRNRDLSPQQTREPHVSPERKMNVHNRS